MAEYNPNRPRPSVDGAAALPGDLAPAGSPDAPLTSAEHAADAPVTPPQHGVDVPLTPPEHSVDTDADPATPSASHLLPRQAEPVDRRLLAAFGGAVAVGWLAAALAAWWLWRRWRRH